MTESQRLLADYVESGSETAFRELVGRYVNLVYSTALRFVGGDRHWAEALRAMNQRLISAATNPAAESSGPPPDATVLAHWPKAQLAFAGYAEPASALQTALWAMSRGDANLLVASVTLEAQTKMAGQGLTFHGARADEIAASTRNIADSLNPSRGFYLVGQKLPSPDRALLAVYFDGEGKTRKVALERIGTDWRLRAMGFAGDTAGEDTGEVDAQVWP